jgi:hypothetical protein
MNAKEVWEYIGQNTTDDYEVLLEIGERGEMVHARDIVSMRVDHERSRVILSTEEPSSIQAPTLAPDDDDEAPF